MSKKDYRKMTPIEVEEEVMRLRENRVALCKQLVNVQRSLDYFEPMWHELLLEEDRLSSPPPKKKMA